MAKTEAKSGYHHGDLQKSLLAAAGQILTESGVDGLSMRKLADRVGVSRTAPYHHFRDKQALLSELALAGFRDYRRQIDAATLDSSGDSQQRLRAFVTMYLSFAQSNPEIYNLMFGDPIWKSGKPSEALRNEAFSAFRRFVELVELWRQHQVLPAGGDALRLAQVAWSTLHGLSRLVVDGIYVEPGSIDSICDTLVALLQQRL